MKIYLLVALFGAIGSVLRYGLHVITPRFFNINFPVSTVIVNLIGSFLIGYCVIFFNKNILPIEYKIYIIYGLLGGFTTFSSFSYDLFGLLQNSEFLKAATYLLISIFFGLLFFYFGQKIAQNI
tara:strand:- start:138 stop:509 length:372 start_codon:yes stop_codon:yes gene_type:complete